MGFLDGIASPFSFHNGTNSCIYLPLWKEQMCSPSESDTKTAEVAEQLITGAGAA